MNEKLDDIDEILLRQIHPNFFQHGQPSSEPFLPSTRDEGNLSVDRSALTSASDAFQLYVANGNGSCAVYGISVGEFAAENLECFSDPVSASADRVANPAHAIVSYSRMTRSQQKNIAKRLKIKAITRGILYPLNV
jgi:hypothetical protein